MKPISPIVPGLEEFEVKLAEKQDEYATLVALPVDDGQRLITRWRLTWRERFVAFINGDIYLHTWTFAQPFQPVRLEVDEPRLSLLNEITGVADD